MSALRPVNEPDESDESVPVELARLYVPRTGDTVHIGYGHDGTEPYVTIGYADNDLVELDMTTALEAMSGYIRAVQGAQALTGPDTGRAAAS